MFRKSKTAAPAELFVVPRLVDVDADYARLAELRSKLLDEQAAKKAEKGSVEDEIVAAPAPVRRVSAAVAAVLGDDVDDGPVVLRNRLAEINARLRVIEDALAELDKRITDAKGRASRAVCAQVRDEYARRVAEICAALVEAEKANDAYMDLIDELEAEDVSWTSLTPMQPSMLGSRRYGETRVPAYLREAAAAGYWNEAVR
ncbi:hypothetical protein [Chenggangzhangella methanolivorans]|uniref:Uncharacterized protein n=1 Tax=Chenggangzhangella methanolivorans TaxID=1437009 RepID=A0A9E6RC87_9HYPH|nr:hypothetical protein [Chenggangzhangella methanolivorans]QZO01660.1 hypothetical protein K6K41_09820 [Chenggangzhangella methanolivorans]